ncbi:hypothetical protein KC340_g6661 [Hortaea werneckii]|nr:hypothetical protein KC342_g6932 [Hortaea werneckii]KAI7098297.1 hypothetical protein KC339_g9062 [Hortaea werneckii]KAI7231706.1 hypothetical protein KC365_g7090 [Hortaea werneckii]KAI7323460.1 hypothetical protein KC340_g6661 [Hortaea werneckii]KAI7392499.1 hypothetical protein KC328_g7018 [Hortaea werneckii]
MNGQQPGYPYPTTLNYHYPANFYPSQAQAPQQQPPYNYQPAHLHQQQATSSALQTAQHGNQNEGLYLHPFFPSSEATSRPGLAAHQQQQRHASTPTPVNRTHDPSGEDTTRPSKRRRRGDEGEARQNAMTNETPAGPSAPGPHGPDLEEQLRDALRREQQQQQVDHQSENEMDTDDHDEENVDPDGDANGNGEGEQGPVFNLPPPPEGKYASMEALEEAMHAWSLEHGYEVVRRASKNNGNGVIYKRYFNCSKHGKVGSGVNSVRKKYTKRTDCPMSLAVRAVESLNVDGEWEIRHRNIHHNHGPLDPLELTGHRRRAREGGLEKAVDGLFNMGSSATQVHQFLQKNHPDGLFTRTDVSNMRLKWKQYGTCVRQKGQYDRSNRDAARTDTGNGGRGRVAACLRCREKRRKCDKQRPVCGYCMSVQPSACEYDCEPPNLPAIGDEDIPTAFSALQAQATPDADQQRTPAMAPQAEDHQESSDSFNEQRRQAERILQDLQAFRADHVKPKRLDLNSSSVEILAQSSTGNLDSYKSVPKLSVASDWSAFADAFVEASLKENTYSTLTGEKTEPVRPVPQAGESEVEVEDWNEYIKQTAIFHRRNSALLGGLWSNIAPSFRARIKGYSAASQAWQCLEEMCAPRGSGDALKTWNELHDITLETCGGSVEAFAERLELKWLEFCRFRLSALHPHHKTPRSSARRENASGSAHDASASGGVTDASDVFPEEALTLLFLRNLGQQYHRWTENLCAMSNVAGFGTGPKVGFRETVKRCLEFEKDQRERVPGREGRR